MIEEALKQDKAPAETAQQMLQFVQYELPAGGAAAEKRFYTLYGPLCERIFGPIQGEKESYRHKEGGWLAVQTRWKPLLSQKPASPKIGAHGITRVPTWESDPVVRLLATAGKQTGKEAPLPTLMEALSNETENRPSVGFSFPFHALPVALQASWMALLDMSMGGKPSNVFVTDNDSRLLGSLLHKEPKDQRGLLVQRQQAAQKTDPSIGLQLSPRTFTSPTRVPPTPSKSGDKEDDAPTVILSMLEYYLIVYIRFPLSAPTPMAAPVSYAHGNRGINHYRSRETPFGETVYYYLFRKYLLHFLPYSRQDSRSISFDSGTGASEIFLRVIIAMWMESQTCVTPTAKVVQSIEERRSRVQGYEPPSLNLNSSYDLVKAKYEPPPSLVKQCLKLLFIHVMSDPKMHTVMDDAVLTREWTLSGAMTALQQPFYNYMRATFRHAPIHATESPFFAAMDLWLMWLEPWNYVKRTCQEVACVLCVCSFPVSRCAARTVAPKQIIGSISKTRPATQYGLTFPKYNNASKYDTAWEHYIAANLYLYTVPLAIFLRRARELDFSSGKFDRSLQIVRRVFRVFTPEVIDAVARHLSGGPTNYSHLVARHASILGAFAVPQGTMSLSSCQGDMHSLLEEIGMQHRKNVGDLDAVSRVFSKVEGIFGAGVVSGEEKELERLVERAKLIVHLPMDYQIFPDGVSPSSDRGVRRDLKPRRTSDGQLTQTGRQQVVRGTTKCDPSEVAYIGDKMYAVVGSHEIPLLVKLFVWLSNWCNIKLGLVTEVDAKDGTQRVEKVMGFRVNLRFMADYRNLIFVTIVCYFALKLIF